MTWTAEKRGALKRLLAKGATYSAAAAKLGVAKGSVCWATAYYGIGRPAADMSHYRPSKPRTFNDRWDERRLVERWADRQRAAR